MQLYHASKHIYDFPDYNKLKDNRDNHLNGNLGLWVAFRNDWISGFGNIVYEVAVDNKDVTVLSLDDLILWEKQNNRTDNYYIDLREELLKKYKVVVFKELSGTVDMGIVLDFGAIKSFNPIKPSVITTPSKKLK